MARHHFKTNGLVSSTNPNGKSLLSKSFILRKKFLSGNITEEELQELVESGQHSDLVVSGEIRTDTPVDLNGRFKTIIVFGKEMRISVEEHNVHNTLITL